MPCQHAFEHDLLGRHCVQRVRPLPRDTMVPRPRRRDGTGGLTRTITGRGLGTGTRTSPPSTRSFARRRRTLCCIADVLRRRLTVENISRRLEFTSRPPRSQWRRKPAAASWRYTSLSYALPTSIKPGSKGTKTVAELKGSNSRHSPLRSRQRDGAGGGSIFVVQSAAPRSARGHVVHEGHRRDQRRGDDGDDGGRDAERSELKARRERHGCEHDDPAGDQSNRSRVSEGILADADGGPLGAKTEHRKRPRASRRPPLGFFFVAVIFSL